MTFLPRDTDLSKATHQRAYSYVNKYGKTVHVKARGIAPTETPTVSKPVAKPQAKPKAPARPRKPKAEKLTPQKWAETLQASLEEWDKALGLTEVHHLVGNIETPEDVAHWLEVHGPRLRAEGHYLMDLKGKILLPTNTPKKSRKFASYACHRANQASLRQAAAQALGLPIEDASLLKFRGAIDSQLAKMGLTYPPDPSGVHNREEGLNWKPLFRQWQAKMKPLAAQYGIQLFDKYANPIPMPLKSLPPAPWTRFNAEERLTAGLQKRGFSRHSYIGAEAKQSSEALATAQALLKAIDGLAIVLNVPERARKSFGVAVTGIEFSMAAANYAPDRRMITLDTRKGKNTFFHEFGHYLDHFFGAFDSFGDARTIPFASEMPRATTEKQKAVHAFIDAVKKTKSYATWKTTDMGHQVDYWHQPTEIYARFFDLWCGYKLSAKGYNPHEFFNAPHYTVEDSGGFLTDEFMRLKPLFEATLGAEAIKALLRFNLAKARTAGAKGKAPKLGKFGALVSSDPSFYPGKGGMRYLAASEVGKVANIVARYAKRGVAVTYVPPVNVAHLDQDVAPITASPIEAKIADDVVAGLDALRSGKPNPERLKALPDIGVDPATRPMTYLLSMGWAKRDVSGKNVLTERESQALLEEFEPTLAAVVGSVGKRLRLNRSQRMELRSDAALFLLESAQTYSVQKRGAPTPGRNFQALVQGSLTRRLAGDLTNQRRAAQRYESYTEEPNRDAGEDLRAAARQARIETPEQRMRRRELGASVSQAMSRVLSPVEYATVVSRLNIANHQTQGISDEALSTGLKVGGLKPWHVVKDDVLGRLRHLSMGVADRAKLEGLLLKVPAANYRTIFERAMDKLRNPQGLTPAERHDMAELADLQRLYLEGERHESFDPEEAVGPLHLDEAKTDQQLRTERALQSLPEADQAWSFWEANEDLARELDITASRAQSWYKVIEPLRHLSSDALRSKLHQAPPKVLPPISPANYVKMVRWALQGSLQKALCVIPPYDAAWANLAQECAVWALNGW